MTSFPFTPGVRRAMRVASLFAVTCAAQALASDPLTATDDSANVPAPAVSDPPQETAKRRRLPFLADEAIKRGHELPLPFGAGLILTGLGGRQIDVNDVRVGLTNPPGSVSDFVTLGAKSDVFNANLKFDAFVLPFLNVYALVGYVSNHSTTHALITVPVPGPAPGDLQFEKTIATDLEGVVGGIGFALAGGYRNFFVVADASYIQSDLGFDDRFKATIATVRAGYRGRIGELPLQMWVGVGNWDTAAIAKGHVPLENVGELSFEVEQEPHTPWMYDVGANLEISKQWQLVLDAGADFDGGYFIVAGPTYRF